MWSLTLNVDSSASELNVSVIFSCLAGIRKLRRIAQQLVNAVKKEEQRTKSWKVDLLLLIYWVHDLITENYDTFIRPSLSWHPEAMPQLRRCKVGKWTTFGAANSSLSLCTRAYIFDCLAFSFLAFSVARCQRCRHSGAATVDTVLYDLVDRNACVRGDWNCRTGHCRTGLAGVDNDGRPTDWRNLACLYWLVELEKYGNRKLMIYLSNRKIR